MWFTYFKSKMSSLWSFRTRKKKFIRWGAKTGDCYRWAKWSNKNFNFKSQTNRNRGTRSWSTSTHLFEIINRADFKTNHSRTQWYSLNAHQMSNFSKNGWRKSCDFLPRRILKFSTGINYSLQWARSEFQFQTFIHVSLSMFRNLII